VYAAMKLHLMCNPASGGETDGAEIERLLERDGATLVEPEAAERIVVSGGDGTVALGAELAARLGLPLAVIPTGTANDFARGQELPEDVEEAARLAVEGEPGPALDLARMDGRPFVNVAAAGLAPAAADHAAPLKGVLGPLAYPAGAIAAGATEDPIACTVDGHFEGEAWQVMVASGGAFGGGAELDAADPADGRLDLVVIPAGPRIELARRALELRRGEPEGVHARADHFTVRVPDDTAFNVDGEVVTAGGAVEFTVEPGAFRLVTGRRRH
jgi:diacylglycerol kinase family enzyme